jgi:tetratricopeptide (TPR) repeat protein
MIVKDESKVIARCLDSVRRFVSHWVVVDTGSTDGTQAIVRQHLAGIPGELHERPWRDFASNRNEAVALARGEGRYALVVDADDVLDADPAFELPALENDVYLVRVEDAELVYERPHLFRTDRGLGYEGVVHETLTARGACSAARLEGLVYRRLGGGARGGDSERYRKDAVLLEAALREAPGQARSAFYLAQSWRDAGEFDKALEAYQRRASMGGWAEEVWCALFEAARLVQRLGRDEGAVTAAYLRAHEFRPQRAESIVALARYLRSRDRSAAAHAYASAAVSMGRPGDTLFVDESVYAWRALDEYAIASYDVGQFEAAAAACERLLSEGKLPPSERERVVFNRSLARSAIAQRL